MLKQNAEEGGAFTKLGESKPDLFAVELKLWLSLSSLTCASEGTLAGVEFGGELCMCGGVEGGMGLLCLTAGFDSFSSCGGLL